MRYRKLGMVNLYVMRRLTNENRYTFRSYLRPSHEGCSHKSDSLFPHRP